MSNPTKLRIDVAATLHEKGPYKLSPSVMEIFQQTVKAHEAVIEKKIELKMLDPQGNPIGTKYHEDGTPKRQRTPEPIGPDGRRRRKQIIKTGMVFGDLIVIRKGPRVKAARPNLAERWRCRCSCGTELIVPKYYLVRRPNPKTHCGCKVKTLKSVNRREYRIWQMIHQRLYNKNHPSYKHYKEKGIQLFPEWHKANADGFKKFFAEVGPAPSQMHSLDRVHNNRGYEPGNLKWSTASEQRLNQGDRIGGYTLEQITDWGYTEDEFTKMVIDGTVPEELLQ